ncbi:unnamed protein product [Aspergillus oryzae]|nr:unnamed protein product [Aspergillus oryzae]GMF93920.1 unnamed protein product [Aspergillus oryzae]GMG34016.1 unnamed protein product [Aspergillus oryzae]GMG50099.1 unnamed protein product [Aspergillus oryzae var. brunneus]
MDDLTRTVIDDLGQKPTFFCPRTPSLPYYSFDLTPATETSAAEAPKEAPAENTQATPAAAAEKENEAPAEQPKEEAGMYTIPE